MDILWPSSPKDRRCIIKHLRVRSFNLPFCVSRCLRDASDDFLLRFLRMQKMNVNKSISVMENYLGFRTNSPEWFERLDVTEADLNDLITSGYIFVLPGRDACGRRVIFSQASSLDGSRYVFTIT